MIQSQVQIFITAKCGINVDFVNNTLSQREAIYMADEIF